MKTREYTIQIDPTDWIGVSEVFSSGTTAGVPPMAWIELEERVLFHSDAGLGPIGSKLDQALSDLKVGRRPYAD